MIGPVPPTSRSARMPSSTMFAASGCQPQCSAATAPSAASRTGRQSATKTIAAASVERGRLAVLVRVGPLRGRRLGRAPDGRAVDLAPVTEARPRMADGLPQPAPVLGDVLGRVVGQQAEVQRLERAARHAAVRGSRRRPARAAGRRRAARPPSGSPRLKRVVCRAQLAAPRVAARGRRAARPSRATRPSPTCGPVRPRATRSSPEIDSLRWRMRSSQRWAPSSPAAASSWAVSTRSRRKRRHTSASEPSK